MAQLIYGKNTVYSALEESKVKKLYLQSNFSDSKMLALIKKITFLLLIKIQVSYQKCQRVAIIKV